MVIISFWSFKASIPLPSLWAVLLKSYHCSFAGNVSAFLWPPLRLFSLVFSSSPVVHLDIILFIFILLGVHMSSWLCKSISFISTGKLLAIIFSKIISSLFLHGSPFSCMLNFLTITPSLLCFLHIFHFKNYLIQIFSTDMSLSLYPSSSVFKLLLKSLLSPSH